MNINSEVNISVLDKEDKLLLLDKAQHTIFNLSTTHRYPYMRTGKQFHCPQITACVDFLPTSL